MITLGEICRPKQWKTLSKAEMADSGFPVYGANGKIGFADTYTHRDPTILIGCRGSCGSVVISEPMAYVNGNAMALDDLDQRRVDLFYLFHYLKHRGFRDVTTGTSQPQIIGFNLRRVEVPLPQLAEQRHIAAILDQADALRIKRREAIAKLDQLLQSVFLDMFGDPMTNPKKWPVGVIGDLLESVKYGSAEKAAKTGDVPILRMNNITYAGEMDLSDLKYITQEGAHEKYLVRPGDILFNRTNSKELVGKTAVYDGPAPMAYAGYLVRARTKSEQAPEYVSGFLNSSYGKATLQGMCKSIVGMANINAREFAAMAIPLPPTDVQATYASRVRSIRRWRRVLQGQSEKFDQLFAALQQRAFDGTL